MTARAIKTIFPFDSLTIVHRIYRSWQLCCQLIGVTLKPLWESPSSERSRVRVALIELVEIRIQESYGYTIIVDPYNNLSFHLHYLFFSSTEEEIARAHWPVVNSLFI